MRTWFLSVWLLASITAWAAGTMPSPAVREMRALAARNDLPVAERVARLAAYLEQDDTRLPALSFIRQLDLPVAKAHAARLFRAKGASEASRLALGHFLLSDCRDHAFAKEFGAFLVPAVLKAETTFMKPLEEGTRTAIGEYAFLAAGFSGYDKADFDTMKDPRAISILIRCLKAPDEVYAKDQGDFIRGKPGTPTGRNLARQNIPFALARLGATEALPALRKVAQTHHDTYLRKNAQAAIEKLTKPAGK
jgi:hypothetical protein